MYRGVLIEESLDDVAILGRLRIVDSATVTIDSPAPGQPSTWTMATFEVDDADAAATAEGLAAALSSGPWYVDFNNGQHSFVVFARRVFSYARGDELTLRAARTHAREAGVPVSQIDWAVQS